MTNEVDLFNALFKRSIGFQPSMFQKQVPTFPPYNIARVGDNKYDITVALAGYGPEDIEVDTEDSTLSISSNGSSETDDDDTVLYRGIAKRKFKLSFALERFAEVQQAKMENGMLIISLERIVPEEKQRKLIAITS